MKNLIEKLDGTHETIRYKTENGIRMYLNKNAYTYPIHWHTGIEIIYTIKSSYFVAIRNKCVKMEPNDILIIPAGELHSPSAPEEYGERFLLQIDCSFLSFHKEMRSIINLLKPYYIIKHNDCAELANELSALIIMIWHEYTAEHRFYQTQIYSLIEQFFVRIGRSNLIFNQAANANISNSSMEIFINVCNYINSNFALNPTLEQVAGIIGYSKSNFCRFFKQYSGKSYYDYLLGVKISHADALLNTTEKKISDIALECGFNSISTFNRVFGRFHGCSPTEYRKLKV
ncbi:MAG TPA: hypothetical protein DCP97_01780 [Ruminococcaceae bacterium]|nr:hypothetical protein [Oscillospiraceae bacterium]